MLPLDIRKKYLAYLQMHIQESLSKILSHFQIHVFNDVKIRGESDYLVTTYQHSTKPSNIILLFPATDL